MNADTDTQDKILSTIGLKRLMIWEPQTYSVYDANKFRQYVTAEYRESQRKATDEVYGMSEINLLHKESGLRLTFTTSESYDGEKVDYKLIDIFIITSSNERLEITDVDFEKRTFFSDQKEIPFAKVDRR